MRLFFGRKTGDLASIVSAHFLEAMSSMTFSLHAEDNNDSEAHLQLITDHQEYGRLKQQFDKYVPHLLIIVVHCFIGLSVDTNHCARDSKQQVLYDCWAIPRLHPFGVRCRDI